MAEFLSTFSWVTLENDDSSYCSLDSFEKVPPTPYLGSMCDIDCFAPEILKIMIVDITNQSNPKLFAVSVLAIVLSALYRKVIGNSSGVIVS